MKRERERGVRERERERDEGCHLPLFFFFEVVASLIVLHPCINTVMRHLLPSRSVSK